MIAQLPMYDFPPLHAATDALWQAVAARLREAGLKEVPDTLERRMAHEDAWRDPHLLLGQSCGYPALTGLKGHLRIIAKPIYAAPGCVGTTHCSFILVRATAQAATIADLRGSRFALNAWNSNTGMNLPRYAVAPLAREGRFFAAIIETGSHAASFAAVAEGRADTAAIDCVSHALLSHLHPDLAAATRIIARTSSSPSLPFVTGHANGRELDQLLRDALAAAIADPALAPVREALLIDGIEEATAAEYDVVLQYETAAQRLGYPILA
ncbi:MAG: PhnD/SsuA/transferrin family substrate-binding protein [Alphaproteobacteria bacterium]|nr:PhnD/SsuA/transferrin family substrate-binding protein [Alphaproteobacteria bacterium]